jgi:chromate transport protein ChrA
MTNGMPDTLIKTLSQSITSIESWPSAVLLAVVLVMVQLFLRTGVERWKRDSNKFQGWFGVCLSVSASVLGLFIPVIVIVIGTMAYSELGDQKNPALVLRLRGFAVGFVAWVAGELTYRIFRKYLPKLSNGNGGNTEVFTKSDN